MESPYKYSPTTPTTLVKADPLQRFLAYLIDGLVAYIPMIVLGLISYRLAFLGYIAAIAYIFVRDALPATGGYLGGQSIGKKLMNIKVIKEATGESLVGDYGTAIVRQIPQLIPLFNIVDAVMVFSDDRLRFGDKWAKTIVVKV